jgi:hypothetical protein
MSIFIHRCVECGHGSHEHVSGRYCSFGYCACTIDASDLTHLPVEQIPVLVRPGNQEPLIAPGERWGGPLGGWSVTCGCDGCLEAYRVQVAS